MALKDDVDLRRVAEARGAASLALSAVSARSQAKLVDALLRLEHGGAAVALLAQFQAGQASGPRRPLPRPSADAAAPDGAGMSVAKATDVLLERLGSARRCCSRLHLALPNGRCTASSSPIRRRWTDGQDGLGRHVLLVGAHALRQLPAGEEAIQAVLEAMARGEVPPGVQAVHAQPMAAEALAVIAVAEGVDEVLVDGRAGESARRRSSGTALAALAELHARAGYPLPLSALWLHDTLKNATEQDGATPRVRRTGAGLWTFWR